MAMPIIPDFTDLRYLNEVGWFLYREKYGYNHNGQSYTEERLVWSQMLLDEVMGYCGYEQKWVKDKTVVSIGCGCTGDLAVWPAATKIALDPLIYVYQKLGMLLEDATHTARTIYLSVGAEELPLLDECADLVLCRNALDHMVDSKQGLRQMWRILKKDRLLFLSVDIGGKPTPDEPTVFSEESLSALLQEQFQVLKFTAGHRPHDEWRDCSVRVLARKKPGATLSLDKEAILRAYETSIAREK
ncbi:MAG TPA: methyltransferase domain-containing protein [Nitrospiraceae bacterium]|nr:methyltransferase domain-containing protein [Nitrospiraceae bacterium]